jgi:hypothetical protein
MSAIGTEPTSIQSALMSASGVKPTWRDGPEISANDPIETLACM